MPPPHPHQQHNHYPHPHQHDALPPSPKPNTKILSLLLKAIIMTLITSLFFLLIGLAALLFLPLLFTSLRRHHYHRRRKADLSNGFSSKDLKKLPQFKFSKRIEADSECVVCLEGLKPGQWCRALVACGHIFHRKCVDTWLVKVAACPTCRTRVC